MSASTLASMKISASSPIYVTTSNSQQGGQVLRKLVLTHFA